jgi:hypothetical protein
LWKLGGGGDPDAAPAAELRPPPAGTCNPGAPQPVLPAPTAGRDPSPWGTPGTVVVGLRADSEGSGAMCALVLGCVGWVLGLAWGISRLAVTKVNTRQQSES